MELMQVGADPERFIARLANWDEPLRRIFNLNGFLEAIRSNEMALKRPHKWDDPREDLTTLCMLDGRRHLGKGQQSLATFLAPVWAQCWSLNPGSDTLLRAYSSVRPDETRRNADRDHEGVTVTTSVRLLLTAAEAWNADGADSHVVIGKVEYLDDHEIWQRIVNTCNGEHGPKFFCTVQGRADSLMWKRAYFEHEQEVRLLLVGRSWANDDATLDLRHVRIEPNSLFTSVSFDPRLQPAEAIEREAELRALGYTGKIVRDESYQKVAGIVEMLHDWPDP